MIQRSPIDKSIDERGFPCSSLSKSVRRSFYVRIIIHGDRNNFIIITSRVNGMNRKMQNQSFSLRRDDSIDSINFRIDSQAGETKMKREQKGWSLATRVTR